MVTCVKLCPPLVLTFRFQPSKVPPSVLSHAQKESIGLVAPVRSMGGESATVVLKLWLMLYTPAIFVAMTFLPVWADWGPTFMGVPHSQSPPKVQPCGQTSKLSWK
ncbi:MAG: hypothetical protein QM820_39910 [Minicystis sp.]